MAVMNVAKRREMASVVISIITLLNFVHSNMKIVGEIENSLETGSNLSTNGCIIRL